MPWRTTEQRGPLLVLLVSVRLEPYPLRSVPAVTLALALALVVGHWQTIR